MRRARSEIIVIASIAALVFAGGVHPAAAANECAVSPDAELEFFTPDGCLEAADNLEARADAARATLYVEGDIDKARLLCEAGDIGQAKYLLRRAQDELSRGISGLK